MINIFQMNDWEISKFLKVILAIQIILLVFIGLDALGVHIPLVREFVALIYLTYIPGILILRILRLHELGNIETLLYAVGLSIASVMIIGFLMNLIYPVLGISNPISISYLLITISIFVLILCVFSYIRDKTFADPDFIDIDLLSPTFLVLCVVPFLAIFGTYVMNFYNRAHLNGLLIGVIGLIAILFAFNKIPKRLYPFAVFIIALSMSYCSSLISMHVLGYDIQLEYRFANLVITNSYWNFTMPHAYNAMLSVSILAPIFSIISKMSLTWGFKIIYPLLFSLVPLGLYRIFQKQTNSKIAFLSCFFFVSYIGFSSGWMSQMARQQIAEIFLILIIMLMIVSKMDRIKKELLFIIFGFFLVVSHYSLTYLFIFILIGALILVFLSENSKIRKWANYLYGKVTGKKRDLLWDTNSLKVQDNAISLIFVISLVVFTLIYYNCISGSITFKALIDTYNNILGSQILQLKFMLTNPGNWIYNVLKYLFGVFLLFIFAGIVISILKRFKTKFKSFTSKLKNEYTPIIMISILIVIFLILWPNDSMNWVQKVENYLMGLVILFILLGIIISVLKIYPNKFKGEYIAMAFMSLLILSFGLIIPSFESSLDILRIYHICFIFLAPFCVVGGIKIFEMIINAINRDSNQKVEKSLQIFSIFLVIFLLFNSGLVSKIGQQSGPVFLNSKSDAPKFNDQEYVSADWLVEKRKTDINIHADLFGLLLLDWLKGLPVEILKPDETMSNSYLYLRGYNVRNMKAFNGDIYIELNKTIKNMSKIYDNGASQIYFQIYLK